MPCRGKEEPNGKSAGRDEVEVFKEFHAETDVLDIKRRLVEDVEDDEVVVTGLGKFDTLSV